MLTEAYLNPNNGKQTSSLIDALIERNQEWNQSTAVLQYRFSTSIFVDLNYKFGHESASCSIGGISGVTRSLSRVDGGTVHGGSGGIVLLAAVV